MAGRRVRTPGIGGSRPYEVECRIDLQAAKDPSGELLRRLLTTRLMVAPGARPRSRVERSESQFGQGSASASDEPETGSLAQYYYVTAQGLGQIPIPVRFRHSWGISVKRFWLSNLRSLFADTAAPLDAEDHPSGRIGPRPAGQRPVRKAPIRNRPFVSSRAIRPHLSVDSIPSHQRKSQNLRWALVAQADRAAVS